MTDDEIRDVHARRCSAQGLFVEPTSAAAHAGLARFDRREAGRIVVVALTGHGLKATGPIGEILGA